MKLLVLLSGASLATVLLAGCQTNTKPPPPPVYSQLMQQAEANVTAQNVDGARLYFHKAAMADPTHKEPWYRLAQLDFNEQNYGDAIVSSQEVLQRDPSDMDAESILTVSGLRVAMDALGRLHDEANLKGPAHQEAEKLAMKLRDTLGEDVLVPKPKARPLHSRHHAVHTDAADTANAADPAAPAADKAAAPAAPSTPSTPTSSDPFSALPGR